MAAERATSAAGRAWLGILGHPVGHSLSPRMHNAAFRAQGVDMVYLAFDVLPERLPEAVEGLRALGLRGVNVTMPHKEAVVRLLDEVDAVAAPHRVGQHGRQRRRAPRRLQHRHDRLRGGAARLSGRGRRGAHVLRGRSRGRGAGGGRGAAWRTAPGRSGSTTARRERAVALCAQAAAWGRAACVAGRRTTSVRRRGGGCDLIVNATSVGLTAVGQGVGHSCRYSPQPSHRDGPGVRRRVPRRW